ncbi:RNA-directed DNA polymerase, eukaryota [Tanacetum coccineum]
MGIDDWHVVSRKKHGYRSYEDVMAKISISIYVSNLPETFSAKDLFHACNKYGHVVDSFIPLKRSKEGKRFGFVKFINVSNVERLVGNLCTVWVGRYKLQANKARFGRPPLNGRNIRNSKSDDRHLGGFKEPNVRPTNGNKETRNNSFASVLKSNQPNNLSSSNMIHDSSPAIALDDDCLSANDLSCVAIGKIKDINALSNLSVILNDEGFDDIKISYLGGLVWIAIEGLPMCAWNNKTLSKIVSPWGTLTPVDLVKDSSLSYRKVCVTTKVSTIINDRTKIIVKGKVYWIRIRELEPWSPELDDEFCESSSDDEFVGDEKNNSITGDANDHVSESSFMNENIENVINEQEPPQDKISEDPFGIYNILNKQDNKEAGQDSDPSHPPGFTQEVNVGVSVNRLGQSAKKQWIRELNTKNKINFVAIQETKLESINLFSIKDLWGNSFFDFSFSSSVGLSGGILCVWDPNSFAKDNATISDYFCGGSWSLASTATKYLSWTGIFPITDPSLCAKLFTDYGQSPFQKKLQALKASIKEWCKDDIKCSNDTCFSIKARLSDLDKLFRNNGVLSNEELMEIGIAENLAKLLLLKQVDGLEGIRFDDSLTLSHFFYADDAVFISKWDRANILTIVRMLKCFFLASGLQINILKSKLMGIGVSNEEVLAAANIIGCSTFSTPFSYLGVKVGMSYVNQVCPYVLASLSYVAL